MDRAVLSPSKTAETPPEKTLKLLHERLDQAEEEARKLSEQLTEYGFNAGADIQHEAGRRGVIEAITPFQVKSVDDGQYDILKKNYEQLVSRVCRTESTVQSLKLALVSLEAENSLMNKQSVAGTLNANEAYEKKLMKLKKELVTSRKQLDESERFRGETEKDFQQLMEEVGMKTGSSRNVVEKVKELKVMRGKLTKRVNELQEEVAHEKNVRISLEDSHEDLVQRVTEMEHIVEKENQEMKLLSGDCGRLKHELIQSKSHYDREYQTRMQLEKLVERLNCDLEDMESKLLNISNERKALDVDLVKFKRENKEQKQQLDLLRRSSERLKEVNLDLEQRYKGASKDLRVTADDNKILIAQHRDVVEKERLALAEKLKEQDKLLDEAKESILEELAKEKQTRLGKEKENVKFKDELTSVKKILHEKDVELLKLKDVLEKLTVERAKMMEENDKAILEIRRDLDNFFSDKISLDAELDQRKVLEVIEQDMHLKDESKRVHEQNERLEEECERLRTRLMELEHQQSNQDRVNTALQDMLEDKRRLAYEKGVLQAENGKLRRTLTTAEKKFQETENELLACRKNVEIMEADMRKVQSLAWDKEKEVKFLLRNKDEVLKETERVIRQTDIYEKRYSKKVDSLQRSLVQSKEDNKKLASTLETVITSHTQLQASFERLQTELGKRDSEAIFTDEERCKSQSKILELTHEVETLQENLIAMQDLESQELGPLRKALKILEEDRDKLMNTVEPLMAANKDLQESLDKLAKEILRKETEMKRLRTLHERNEMKMENMAKENKVDEAQKQFEKEMKEMRIKHKKEITKLRKEFQDLLSVKNVLKEENNSLKRERKEEEIRHKKLREKFKVTKNQLEQCLKEVETAGQRIEAMSRELATLEHLKTECTRNNVEQAASLQEFVSQLTDLQEEFRSLSSAQQETSLLCRQKDEEINKEKLRRKETEVLCYKLKNREKELRERRNDTERKLEEANVESQQVAANLQEAHEWFKDKFTNLQSELSKSKKVQSVLQKDNVDQYKALQDERRRAEEATERAKKIIKSSRMMISKLVGQVAESGDESNEIQEAMAREKHKVTPKTRKLLKETLPKM